MCEPQLISLIAIPLSLMLSLITLKLLGLTINTMSLGGMAIAIGALVDDAIIDVENVLKRLKQNHRKADKETGGCPEGDLQGLRGDPFLHCPGHPDHHCCLYSPLFPVGNGRAHAEAPGNHLYCIPAGLPAGGPDPDPGSVFLPAHLQITADQG